MTDRDMVPKAEVLDIYAELYDEFDGAPGIIKVLNKVYDKLERLQPQKPVVSPTVDGWISVKDRLPEECERYLCWFGGNKYAVGMEIETYLPDLHGFGSFERYEVYPNISHWMPLPEPPKEENEDA